MTTNTFDAIAAIYAEARPGYPNALYREIAAYTPITRDSRILEVGAGPGTATKEMYAQWHPHITALEPGKNLFDIATKRYGAYDTVQFVHCTYEQYKTDTVYDCIVSATAFHWIDPAIKYKKSFHLLNDNGALILFWNSYLAEDKQVFKDIQEIYAHFHPKGSKNDIRNIQKEKIQARKREIETSGYFHLVHHKCFTHTLVYSTARFIQLLQSFSDNALPPESIRPFYSKIRDFVNALGGEIAIAVTTSLHIAEKRKK